MRPSAPFVRSRHTTRTAQWPTGGWRWPTGRTKKRAKAFIKEAGARIEKASAHNRLYIEAQANYLDGEPKDAKKRKTGAQSTTTRTSSTSTRMISRRAPSSPAVSGSFSRGGLPIHSHEGGRLPCYSRSSQRIRCIPPTTTGFTSGTERRPAAHSIPRPSWATPLRGLPTCGHMPGHIYSKLKRWDDSAFAQEASARTDHQYMITRRVLPDQIHNYAHKQTKWLARKLDEPGAAPIMRSRCQRGLLANPRHPKTQHDRSWRPQHDPTAGSDSSKCCGASSCGMRSSRSQALPTWSPPPRKKSSSSFTCSSGAAHFGKESVVGLRSVEQEIEGMLQVATRERDQARKRGPSPKQKTEKQKEGRDREGGE